MEKLQIILDIKELLKIYKLDKKIAIWNKLQIKQDEVIIPKSFQQLPGNVAMWAIFLFAEFQEINTINDFEDILLKNEIKQLSIIGSFIQTYNTIQSSFIWDKKWKIKDFLQFLKGKINKTWSLWNFIKELLENIDAYKDKNIDDIIEDYISYKTSYDELTEDGENELEDHDKDEYYERQDMSEQESMPWEDNWVIAVLDSIVNERYFAETTKEAWSDNHLHFGIPTKTREKIEPEQFSNTMSNYSFYAKKWKTYCLPLSKKLKPVSWDNDDMTIFQDRYGHIFVEALADWQLEISISYNMENNDFGTTESEKLIYSGNKIDISSWDTPDDIQSWIRKEKNYSVDFQKTLEEEANGDTNKYLELIYKAEAFECDTANIFFVAMCKELWYKARIVHGYSVYKKEGKTYVSKNRWHAWSEVWIDDKWKLYDATPIRWNDDDNGENKEWDIWDVIEEIIDKEQIWEWDDLELKKVWQDITKNLLANLESIDNPYFESAVDFVKDDVVLIVSHIRNILKQRDLELKKRKLRWVPKSRKSWLSTWNLRINSSTIEKLAVWNPNVFERNRKLKAQLQEDIDTKLKDITIAIDTSGSMGSVRGDWENWSKADYAYLSLVLIYLVAKELDINVGDVVLFASATKIASIEKMLKNFNNLLWWGNEANTAWIKRALESIKNTEKWVCFVLTDGDGETGTAFFDDESRDILRKNKKLAIVGYGIGEDATTRLSPKIEEWYIPTVIEYRMKESENHKQSKWYNVEDYKNIVWELKKWLSKFMTQSNIEL